MLLATKIIRATCVVLRCLVKTIWLFCFAPDMLSVLDYPTAALFLFSICAAT